MAPKCTARHGTAPHLLPPRMRQHAAVLEDEQGLHAARRLAAALLGRRPSQWLELHLAVDARKLAALLQHRLRGGVGRGGGQAGGRGCWRSDGAVGLSGQVVAAHHLPQP